MVEISTIFIADGATGESVEAQLHDAIGDDHLADWRTKWVPAREAIKAELDLQRVPFADRPQSLHWDWPQKTLRVRGFATSPSFCVVANGETEGLALLDLNKEAAEPSQSGSALVYIDYLEVAPWNWPGTQTPRYRGIGMALMTAAVMHSQEVGYKGRIGLHALPQAEEFYRHRGMTDLGIDPKYMGLRRFEMTSRQAATFLE